MKWPRSTCVDVICKRISEEAKLISCRDEKESHGWKEQEILHYVICEMNLANGDMIPAEQIARFQVFALVKGSSYQVSML